MRSKVGLYRDPAYNPDAQMAARDDAMTDDDDNDVPQVRTAEGFLGVCDLQITSKCSLKAGLQ